MLLTFLFVSASDIIFVKSIVFIIFFILEYHNSPPSDVQGHLFNMNYFKNKHKREKSFIKYTKHDINFLFNHKIIALSSLHEQSLISTRVNHAYTQYIEI